MDKKKDLDELTKQFYACRQYLQVIGDETRQHIMLVMIQMGSCEGARAIEIAKAANLSRPSVSHHLSVMKKAGLIKVRKEGTKNYYSFDQETKLFDDIIQTLTKANKLLNELKK